MLGHCVAPQDITVHPTSAQSMSSCKVIINVRNQLPRSGMPGLGIQVQQPAQQHPGKLNAPHHHLSLLQN